jgi:VIT1/CCC1 family predicted Fe2+/Mn2+ transporter
MLRKIREQIRNYQTRFSFGSSAALITNLGLITGLNSTNNAKFSIITSILVIAIADNISDSFGIHVYQESEHVNRREVWVSTATNFLARLLVSLVFVLLVALLPIGPAVVCSLVYGLLLLTFISYIIAKDEKVNPFLMIAEHLGIALVVILLSEFVGKWLLTVFM